MDSNVYTEKVRKQFYRKDHVQKFYSDSSINNLYCKKGYEKICIKPDKNES